MLKSSNSRFLSGHKFSWLYPLIVTAIALPAVCVVWFLREALKSEEEAVNSLIDEAQERALQDFEKSIINLFAQRLEETKKSLNSERVYNVRLLNEVIAKDLADAVWVLVPGELVTPRDREFEGRALLERARGVRRATLGAKEKFTQLMNLLEDSEVRKLRLKSGRNAALMVCVMAFEEIDSENGITSDILALVDSVLDGTIRMDVPYNQYSYFYDKYGDLATSELAKKNVEAMSLLRRWQENAANVEQVENGVFTSGDIVCYKDDELILLYKESSILEMAGKLDERIELSFSKDESAKEYARKRVMFVPLERFTIAILDGFAPETANRTRLFLFIGGLVLVLSIVSGSAVLLLIRKQRDAAQLKNDLVATVTHELKTPVASIRLLVDTMLDESRKGFVDTGEYLELIDKENKRLGYLIDNFLSYSRMERNKSSFDIGPIDAVEVAQSAKEIFTERFKGKRYSLATDFSDDLPDALGNVEILSTAVGNLLENALKYGGKEPEITLRVTNGDNGVEFSVIDKGAGIPRSEQKKIFRKFYQSKRRLSDHSGGVGLGLSIVSFIVSKHGGSVGVQSEVGEGSCFTITIPYA
ncbi:HAMP domain-containing histidine kinase [Puniceicoccaceae bacterium K14]|nr:HAMP domain-containing histidine kinase [Puniceicoccaceae bacterium K14]